MSYDYGPPVSTSGTAGSSQSNSGVTSSGTSTSPHTPPGNTGTSSGTSGSPSEASGSNTDYQSTVASLNPTTSAKATPTVVTVTGTKFTPNSAVSLNGVLKPTTYVSATTIRATFSAANAGVQVVKVQTGAYLSATSANYTFT